MFTWSCLSLEGVEDHQVRPHMKGTEAVLSTGPAVTKHRISVSLGVYVKSDGKTFRKEYRSSSKNEKVVCTPFNLFACEMLNVFSRMSELLFSITEKVAAVFYCSVS